MSELLQDTSLGQLLARSSSSGRLNDTRAPCSCGRISLRRLLVKLTVPRRYLLSSPDLLTDLQLSYKFSGIRPSRLLRDLRTKRIFKKVKLFKLLRGSSLPAVLRNSTLTDLIGKFRFPSLGNNTLSTLLRHIQLPPQLAQVRLKRKTLPRFWCRLRQVTLSNIFSGLPGLGRSADLSLADFLERRQHNEDVAEVRVPPLLLELFANFGRFSRFLIERIG